VLDGLIPVEKLLAKALESKMPSLAITDHGNMFGALEFYTAARAAGIKPIIGSEMYLAPGSRLDRSAEPGGETSFHLILLARNEAGYRNLMQLSSASFLEGFYYKPRIDKELLARHSDGLLVLSSCIQGEVAQAVLKGSPQKAREAASFYRELFGPNYFLEIQDHNLPEERQVIPELAAIAREMDIPLVATNDVHYLEARDAKAHDALLCIQTGRLIADSNRMKFSNDNFYFKSPAEMAQLFRDFPQAVDNTMVVSDRCNLVLSDLGSGKLNIPSFQVPPEFDGQSAYLRYLAETGLARRYPAATSGIRERLNKELEIIDRMNFPGYFLVVKDFIDYARANQVPVGPGRGSAVGSLVLYCLGITDVEPLRYNLLFERFLNPERVSMPDIDIDFGDTQRARVIDYVNRKYGAESVAQIITFGSMKAKMAVRDVGRVYGLTYGEADKLAKLIPDQSGKEVTIAGAIANVPELAALVNSDPRFQEVIEVAQAVEGRIRNVGTHAAGVVITPGKLTDYLPLFKSSKGDVSTQYDMGWLEKCGLLKMDFLGLRNLTVIDDTVRMLREKGVAVEVGNLPPDDPLTLGLLQKGDTTGIFQLEGPGMRDTLVKLQPTSIDDIIAVISLYRPGPMDLIPDFLERKHGRKKIEYEHSLLEPICRNTYGILIYQEQVMQAVQALAGYSLGAGYIFLKAISKKKKEVLEQQRPAFVKGCKATNNIPEAQAERIFDILAKFAGYGFNKSHAAGYAVLAYQTAYLKAHHPLEYMSALLSSLMGDTAKTLSALNNCRETGISLLPPDINASRHHYQPEGPAIRFGLGAIKNVGGNTIESIIAARQELGRLESLQQMLENVDPRVVNRKVLESLIKAGCFDAVQPDREGLLQGLERTMEAAAQVRHEREMGQTSIFDPPPGTPAKSSPPGPEAPARVDRRQFLAFEKEALGFYLSGHPLDKYAADIQCFATNRLDELGELEDHQPVIVAGLISAVKTISQKNGKPMAFVSLEDLTGFAEVVVFSDILEAKRELVAADSVVLVAGAISTREEEAPKIVAADFYPLAECRKGLVQHLEIQLEQGRIDDQFTSQLTGILNRHPGVCPVSFALRDGDSQPLRVRTKKFKVLPDHNLLSDLNQLLGGPCYRLGGKWQPAAPRKQSPYHRKGRGNDD
jgi:DNA polymerase-3 subunit alpha